MQARSRGRLSGGGGVTKKVSDAEIIAAYEPDLSYAELSRRIGLARSNVMRRVQDLGLRQKVDKQQRAEAIRTMLKTGISTSEIQKTLRCDGVTVTAIRDQMIGGYKNAATLLLYLPDDQREWLLANTPKGAHVFDLVQSIITDAMEEE